MNLRVVQLSRGKSLLYHPMDDVFYFLANAPFIEHLGLHEYLPSGCDPANIATKSVHLRELK